MIYCVWYPSGGFGHFVNAVLTLHGDNFVRPKKSLSFSNNGNSHNLDYVAPPYTRNQNHYNFDFNPAMNYSVIVDNGITSESTEFTKFFLDATVVKICYSDFSWPMVANTMLSKAMRVNIDQELAVDDRWPTLAPWAQREKYFLFLRDHPLRNAWKPSSISHNVFIEDLLDYSTIIGAFDSIDVALGDFKELHTQWRKINSQYLDPVLIAKEFVNGNHMDIPISDIWTQAVVYYQIWCLYGIEVPHNDIADFFQSQEHFQEWLKSSV